MPDQKNVVAAELIGYVRTVVNDQDFEFLVGVVLAAEVDDQ